MLIGSQMMDLFTLKSAIKDKTILCIPFTLQIPTNFTVSYNHNLDFCSENSNDIKSLELKRTQILKNRKDVNYSGFMRKTVQKSQNKNRRNRIFQKKKDNSCRYGDDKQSLLRRVSGKLLNEEPDNSSRRDLEVIKEEE